MRTARVKIIDVKAGDVLIADGGFTCIKEGARLVVKTALGGFCVDCAEGIGGHDLSGQIDGDDYLGFTKEK